MSKSTRMSSKSTLLAVGLCVMGAMGSSMILATRPAHAAPAATADAPTITVVGQADEKVSPNTASVSGGVTSQGTTAQAAESANNAAMDKVIAALKAAGIKPADIQTDGFSLYPNTTDKQGKQVINGFQATNNVDVTIHNLKAVGSLIDSMVQAGANQIQNVSYSLSNANAIQKQLYGDALTDARSQAQTIADKLGVSITGVKSVDASNNSGVFHPVFYAKMASASEAAVPLSPGTHDVSTSVTVVYTITG